ncbi:DUF1015 domain-containing protein [Thermodesulfobacteriota bacterium]
MADITPFKGVLYNPSKITNLSDVTAPPFDIISKQEQHRFHETHPQNIIRLTLGRETENDTEKNNRYTRAADCFNQWLSEGVLLRDETPALYLTTHEFPFENKPLARYGLIARVGLVPFEEGVVLPHEKTFSNVKAQRLELIKACQANFSSIFSMYSDKGDKILSTLKDAVLGNTPVVDFNEKNGHRHKMWRITDSALHRYIADAMKDSKIYIADGHHRYETALNYRKWLSETKPDFSADHPANSVLMYLCSMEDPGLIVLPAHRMLDEVPSSARASLISLAAEYFDITKFPYKGNRRDKSRDEFISALKSSAGINCIGVYMKECPEFYLLKLKPGVMERMFGDELSKSLIDIDVTVLDRLIFMEILGFDQARLDDEKLISYSSIAEEAVDIIAAGKHDIAFILNPTRIDQVRRIAEEGLIMPNKATYFYPKVITGQIINKL